MADSTAAFKGDAEVEDFGMGELLTVEPFNHNQLIELFFAVGKIIAMQ